MRKYLFALFFLLSAVSVHSQTDSLYIYGHVVDGFTGEQLPGATIRVSGPSGRVLVETMVYGSNKRGSEETILYNCNVARHTRYKFHVSLSGYKDIELERDVPLRRYGKRIDTYSLGDIELFPQSSYRLDEVTVKASKILMVMKGDTIEYNASSFRLSEGSMLDNLIRELPGAKLDDQGRITVNGEFVRSLLINGRDFFKGNPKVALNNLPAYTVDKIKVYKKEPETAYLEHDYSRRSRQDDPLVMDVHLKREYSASRITNYEAGGGWMGGGGSRPAWLLRMFAMRFTPVSSIGTYVNANNMNDSQNPGGKGEWRRVDPGEGEKRTLTGGMDYSREWKESKTKLKSTFQAQVQHVEGNSRSLGEEYYAEGNTYTKNMGRSNTDSHKLKWTGEWSRSLGFVHLSVSPELRYSHNKSSSDGIVLKGDTPDVYYLPSGLAAFDGCLSYGHQSVNRTRIRDWRGGLRMKLDFVNPIPGTKKLPVSLYFQGGGQKSVMRSTDLIVYSGTGDKGTSEGRRSSLPARNHRLTAFVEPFSYNIDIPGFFLPAQWSLSYTYEHSYDSGSRRLERSDTVFSISNPLPSLTGSGLWLADHRNSYHTRRQSHVHTVKSSFLLAGKFNVQADLEVSFRKRTLTDERDSRRQSLNNSGATFNPVISIGQYGKGLNWGLSFIMRENLPEMSHILDVRDDSSPLVVNLGNPDLRKTRHYDYKASFQRTYQKHLRMYNILLAATVSDNLVAVSRSYNRLSGVTTYRPVNVDGNWDAVAMLTYSQSVDRNDRITLSNEFSSGLVHSVDYSSAGSSLDAVASRTAANRYKIHDELSLRWRMDRLTLGGKLSYNKYWMRSCDDVFSPFSYTELNYGLSMSCRLFWSIDLETDMMAYCRRGFSESSMNTTDWVWNISLSRGVGSRNQWVVKLVGYDILQQLPSIRRVVNAQGMKETRFNTMPSYVTVHLLYRLDRKPKKKVN